METQRSFPSLLAKTPRFRAKASSQAFTYTHMNTLKAAQGWAPLVLQGQESTRLPEKGWYLKLAWYLIL